MQRHTWYRLFAVGVMAVPIGSRAQGPQPKIRELAVMPGVAVGGAALMPNGRIIVFTLGDTLFAYDPSTKRSTVISHRLCGEFSISPAGDRIAFSHRAESGYNCFIASIPVNPQTAASTGLQQQVSISGGDSPTFSPDGKRIAFLQYPPINNLEEFHAASATALTVVPASGGPEQVLAKSDRGIFTSAWSADGQWIYADISTRDSIVRVPASGGKSQTIIKYSGSTEAALAGGIALFRRDPMSKADGRIGYASSSGSRGEMRIPGGARWAAYAASFANPLVTVTKKPTTAHVISMAGGKPRELLAGSVESRLPVWSPDGRRVAFQQGAAGHVEITIMNADGSQVRHYPITVAPSTAAMQWSPNGQLLTYSTGAGPQRYTKASLAVLDAATGKSRVLVTASSGGLADAIWRPDSKSILAVRNAAAGSRIREIVEVAVDGAEHRLREIGDELSDLNVAFNSDQSLLLGNGVPGQQRVMLTSGGAVKSLPRGSGAGRTLLGASPDGRWIAWLLRNKDGAASSVELMTTGGDSLRTLPLSFEPEWSPARNTFHPDGKDLIIVGKSPGESLTKLFLVPLNGDAPRVLAQFPEPLFGRLSVSPDGKSLAYTTEGPPTSTIYEVDLSPFLQLIKKR